MAGVTAKRAPRGFSEKGTGDDCARLCSLFASFLPFFPSFFFLCLRFPYHSPPRFDRVVRKDGWCWRMDRWRSMTREWFVFRDCLSGMLFISNVVQFRYWFDVDLTFKFYGGESNGAIMRMKFTFSRGNSSFVLQAKRVILFRSFHIRGRILSFGQQRRY